MERGRELPRRSLSCFRRKAGAKRGILEHTKTMSRPGSPRVEARRCEMNKTSFTAFW